MSSIYSSDLYKEFEELRQKLLRVKGAMSEEEYSKLNEKIKELSREILDLGDNATKEEFINLIKKITEIKFNMLTDKNVEQLEKSANIQNFINMLNTVEEHVEDIDKVKAFIKEARPYWDKIKNSYDNLEQAKVVERMTMVLLKFNMAKAMSCKKLDMAELPQVDNIGATHALIDFLNERSDKASGMDKATLELYLGKIIDRSKGIINIEEAERLVREEKLWNTLLGDTKVEFLSEGKTEGNPSDSKGTKEIEEKDERTYEDELKEMADKYQVPWKKLMTNTGDIALIIKDKKGKCKVQKVRQYNHITRALSEDKKLRDECVAVVFNNQIKVIDNDSFYGFVNLEEVRLPDSLSIIGERAFEGSGIKEVILPIWTNVIREAAFLGCRRLEKVELNEGLERIDTWAFSSSAIKSIKTPDSLRTIGIQTFQNCTDLEVVQLNTGLKVIGEDAFKGAGVVELEIPERLVVQSMYSSNTKASFIWKLDSEGVNDIPKLKSVKVVDGERKSSMVFEVVVDEDGNRRIVSESPEKSRHSNRNGGIDR